MNSDPSISEYQIDRQAKCTERLDVSIMGWKQALSIHREGWTKLVKNAELNPTLLPDWLDISLDSSGVSSAVHAFTVSENGLLKAVVPFFFSEESYLGLRVRKLNLLSNIVSYHAALPTRIDQLALLECFLRSVERWDIFHVGNLHSNSETDLAIRSLINQHRFAYEKQAVENSPYLSIGTDWDTFLASRKKKFRYKLRQRDRLLDAHDHLELLTYNSDAECTALLNDIIDIDKRSWKARYGLDIGAHGYEARYYSALLPLLAQVGSLHADLLKFDGRPIAYSLCCNWNGWFGQLKTSFDESFQNLSPGSIVIDASIKAAFDANASEFDFLGDADRHKFAWTKRTRQHYDYFIYSATFRARCIYRLKRTKNRLFPHSRTETIKPKDN